MFTGIIEETGIVESIKPGANGIHLTVRVKVCGRGTRTGDSIAVNGCCLTVVRIRAAKGGEKRLDFDLLLETWNRTNLSALSAGSRVNLERALEVGARLGGHFVSGHVDGTGRIRRWEPRGADSLLEIDVPAALRRYLLFKGSIAIDGISLTIAEVTRRGLIVWIIPHTRSVTALQERAVGDRVNLEADLLGKFVERLLKAEPPGKSGRRAASTRTR